MEKVLFTFWDARFRLLSSEGLDCTSRRAAMTELFDRIAARESIAGYLNTIYDNAQVELQEDNMQTVTVLDHYYIRDIYVSRGAADPAGTVFTFEAEGEPVGMAYAAKDGSEPEPDFEQALEQLMQEMRRRGREYLRQEKKLCGD